MYENIIIIPFRDREEHLKYFIENTAEIIKKNLPNTKIIVIEQNNGKLFNRGILLNIGFNEYKNKTQYFFTHDIDINPSLEIVKNIYTKKDIKVFRIKSAHSSSLGGIVKIEHDTIFNINGFPNYIWGWGIEDRALYFRCYIRNVNIINNNQKNFKILNHKSNSLKYTGEKKKFSDIWRLNYINSLNDNEKEKLIIDSGINNLKYKILKKEQINSIVELIKVEI